MAKQQKTLEHIRLMVLLSAFLKEPPRLKEPFILQDRIPQTRTRHAVVIWDAWANLDRNARSQILLGAYEKSGVLKGDTITVALGLTQQEAVQMGYLPYSIIALRREADPVQLSDLTRAMEKAGGIVVRTGSLVELRFPSMELAREAYRTLAEAVPGPYWTLQHERAAEAG